MNYVLQCGNALIKVLLDLDIKATWLGLRENVGNLQMYN